MSRPRLIFPLIVLTFGLIGLLAACRRGDETVPQFVVDEQVQVCLLYTSPSPRD